MKSNFYGRLWGFGQLIFWLVLIPWIIITIPLNLYYENPNKSAPGWLDSLYSKNWINWQWGVIILSLINILIIGTTLIWMGWQTMHPITQKNMKVDNHARLKLVKSFSKEKYLQKIKNQASEYHKKKFYKK